MSALSSLFQIEKIKPRKMNRETLLAKMNISVHFHGKANFQSLIGFKPGQGSGENSSIPIAQSTKIPGRRLRVHPWKNTTLFTSSL
jgi:hypothetical protein